MPNNYIVRPNQGVIAPAQNVIVKIQCNVNLATVILTLFLKLTHLESFISPERQVFGPVGPHNFLQRNLFGKSQEIIPSF